MLRKFAEDGAAHYENPRGVPEIGNGVDAEVGAPGLPSFRAESLRRIHERSVRTGTPGTGGGFRLKT